MDCHAEPIEEMGYGPARPLRWQADPNVSTFHRAVEWIGRRSRIAPGDIVSRRNLVLDSLMVRATARLAYPGD